MHATSRRSTKKTNPTAICVSYSQHSFGRPEWVHEAKRVRIPRGVEETLLETARCMHTKTTGAMIADGEVLYKVDKLVK